MSATTDFIPIGLAVLTVSDTRTAETDTSGDILEARIRAAGHRFVARAISLDDVNAIQGYLRIWIDDPDINAIITTGGTGLTGRDITPEAIAPLLDKIIDGFSVIFHKVSFDSIGLSTLQSRALAGVAGQTYIFALPGSNGAVKDGWDKVIAPQLDSRTKPCNMVTILPRLKE